jgi:hypothetical protein
MPHSSFCNILLKASKELVLGKVLTHFSSAAEQVFHDRVLWDDRFCGLVVRVSGYRSRGPGSIPGASIFSEKQRVWNGVHSAS